MPSDGKPEPSSQALLPEDKPQPSLPSESKPEPSTGALSADSKPKSPIKSPSEDKEMEDTARERDEHKPSVEGKKAVESKPDQQRDKASPVKTPSRDKTPNDQDSERKMSLGERTRERVTTEPKFSVAIGRAKSMPRPDHEGKQVILQKVCRKTMRPKQAASKGVVDEKTAAILEDPNTFRGPEGESLSLEDALRLKKVDGNSGAIVDIACGVPLTINEAVENGVLDGATGRVLVPVGRSVTLPEVISQGLYDIESQRFIHPETGTRLTLHEAILCDIIDPSSQILEPDTQQIITLDEAISKGIINQNSGQVNLKKGPVSMLEAVDASNVFVTSAVARVDWLPPLGMTFPVALERGLVDADNKEIINPVTSDRQPLKMAIDNDFILALPCPILPDSVQVTQALDCKLINTNACTFTVPNTGEEVPVMEAVESGLLQIRPMTKVITDKTDVRREVSFTETVTSYETITTKTVRVVSGYVLISPTEVKNTNTGEVITLEEAKKQGMVVEIDSETSGQKLTFREAVERGLIDFASGTFQDPETNRKIPIDKAIQLGLVEPVEPAPSTEVTSKINIMQAFSTIYHEQSGKFKDPQTGTLLTLDEAVDKGVIDPDAMVYDTKSGDALTTKEAIDKGVIDVKAGDFIDPKSGTKVKVKDAVKMGLLAVIGAPILAGMAVKEVIKGAREKMKTSPKQVRTTIVTEIVQEYMPARTAEDMLQRPSLSPEDKLYFPIIEVGQKMTLRTAMEGCYIDVDLCVVVVPSTGDRQPLRRAVREGSITLVTVIEIRSRTEIWIVEEITIITEVVKTLDPAVMAQREQYDPENGNFIDPRTGEPVSFQKAVEIGSLIPDHTLVKDPLNGREIPLTDAIKEGIVDPTTGEILDSQTGECLPFFEAAKNGLVKADDKKELKKLEEKPEPMIALNEAIEQGLLKPDTGMFTNPTTGKSMVIGDAVQSGLLDPSTVQIFDPRNEDIVSLKEAVEIGLVDLDSATFTDPENGCEIDFTTALTKGILVPKRKPMSLVAVVRKNLYDPKSGKITDTLMKQKLDVDDAVKRGVVDSFITLCKDAKADKFITLDDALTNDLVVAQNGKLKNTKKNTFITFDEAVRQSMIVIQRNPVTLTDAVLSDMYDPQEGHFYDACEGEDLTLNAAIFYKLVDANTCRVKINEETYTVSDALDKAILDGENGKLLQPEELSLDEAVRKGYLVPAIGSLSLQQVLEDGLYDPETGLITVDGDRITIKEAVQRNIIDPSCLSVKDPRTGEPITLEDAIKVGIIDPTTGTFRDPVTGADVELMEALTKGVVIEGRTKFTLYQAVTKGLYNPSTGRVTSPLSPDQMTVGRAIRAGLIDTNTTLARDPTTEKLMSFKHAIGKELVDTRTGMFNFGRIKKMNFKDAFEQDYLLEAPMPMALRVVIMKELYEEECGKFLNPSTGEWITLSEALAIQMIDPDSTHVKDTLSGRLKKVNLREAVEYKIIDGESALVKNHQTGSWHTLLEAYELTLIVDSRVAMSLQRALHQGLLDDEQGLLTDVNTGRKITLHEAMRRLVINPSLPCYWDSNTSNCLSLVQTCREGIIDRRHGKFNDPKSGCTLTLIDALEHGMILDIDKPQSLYDAVTMGFHDNKSGRMIQPNTGRKLTLADACKQDIVDPSISVIRDPIKSRFLKLNVAVDEGIIDDMKGKYIMPKTKEELTLEDAVDKHLIVTSKRPLTVEEALQYCLFSPETGRFTEPCVGDKLDIAEAITHGLIDGNTSALKNPVDESIKSIRSAIEDKEIDASKGLVTDPKSMKAYTINVAYEKGLIVTVGKPISFMQAVREGSIDFEKGTYTDPESKKEYTLEEALCFELIDPDSAVIKDPNTGRYKTLKRAIGEGLIDLKKRALFDPQTGTLKTLCIIFDQGTIVFLREPLSFDEAIDKGYLNPETGMYTDPNSKEVLNLKETCRLGLIDSETVLIKNTRNRQLLQPVEACEIGAVDAEKGMVYNTATSHLLTMAAAIETGLIVTPRRGLALLEALDYGLFSVETGRLLNPHLKQHITLQEAIACGLIDSTTTMVKCPSSGNIQSMTEAVRSGVLDEQGGAVVDSTSGTRYLLPEARRQGYLLTAQARQAMIEKYRQCDATIVDMVDSVNEIERRLAEQEPVSENPNGLRNQINTVKAIKDELDEMFRPLGTCLDGVRQVVNQGGDVLSREELESLDQAATLLKQRYDHCVVQADTTHRRLTTAMEEFSKYEKEIALFQTWLKQATKTLLEKERLCSDLNKIKNHEQGCRDFLGDVIAHQADLRFITMATQKFLDESSLYLRTVNNFRTSLPERYPLLQADPDSMVRDAADDVTAEFKDLLARANKLVDKATSVGNKQRDYTEAIEKATRWLKDTEVKVVRILQEPVGADPKGVQDQLDKAKAINNDVVAQSRLFDNCRATSVSLLRALEGELDAREQEAIEHPPEELYERYAELADRLGYRCQELDTALVQCQGVQEGLDSLMSWLNSIDLQLKNASKPASLNRDRLDEQLREHRQLHADIMSHQASVVQINDSAEALLTSASNARVAKKIETKLRELNTKFEKVVEKSEYRGQHLEIVSTQLDAFTVSVEHFEEWYIEIVEIVESREVLSLDVESYARKIDEIARQRDSRSDDFDGMIRTGREMVTKKDVTDTAPVKDKIKNLEGQWKELNDTLDERARNGKERSEQLLAYEQLRDRCTQWLTTTENTLDNAQPVGLDQEVVKRQVDDLKPLLKEYREYGTTFDKLNELGNAYDALLRGERPESPSRRRSSVTPVKRPSITSPLKSPVRRVSQDARSPSPSHKLMGFNGSGPLSPIPGGYASRRTSQEGFHLDDMSPIQKELMQVNNRYDMIGMRLNDRQNELDVMKDELKKLADSIRSVTLALDKSERSMPREAVPTTKEEADKHNRQCKSILDDLLEKQLSLDSLKNQVTELIKKRPTAPGADTLQDQADILNDRYRELQGRLKDRLTFLEHTKDFLDSFDSLNNWLNSKDRMMSVLGPIASDPRMVQMQAQQVQVLRDEFQAQEPKLGDLNDAGDKIIGVCEPNSMAAKKINDKLDSINNKWTELIGQLDARDSALNAASDASTDFYDNYNKLHDTLLKLGDDFDEVNANGADSAQQIEAVNTLGKGLETARGSLIDLEGLGDHLISILSDPSSKNDIKSKITQLNKMFNNLEKKLGNRKSELEASLRDEEMFGQQCQDIQEWLADQVAHLKDQLLVSADRDTLSNQVGDFEPIYRDLMAKEHEVIMMINKGKEIVAKSSRKELNRQLSETLDAIKKEWDNVRKTAVDRRTRLQKCMDTCNKFHSLQDKFNPWLDKAEEKAHNLEPIAFTKKAIDKQIKEIQSFKNEVSRHSGEFENNRTGGEKFISCTDTDHDGVHDALAFMKERWDQLNAIVFARAQDLDDVAAKLVDFNDKARDLDHTLQRCGDRLASLDTLAGTGKDAKSLERMKALLEETDALGKQVDQVKNKGEDLCGAAEALGSDANHIQDEVERLADRYGDLKGKLEDRCHDLEEASQAVNQFGTLVKNMGQELTGLDDELDRMGSVGRDVKTVTGQIDQLQSFLTKVDHKNDEIEDAKAALEDLVSQGFTNTNNRTAEDQIKQLRRQLKKIQDRCDVRGKDLDTVLKKLENFYGKYNSVMDDINEADKDGESFKPVGADVDTIITQQEEFKHFKGDRVEALGKQVNECNKLGQGLIQSAASGVNTQALENDIDGMNELWNKLKEMIGDREKALDKGLMQSGKFQDALDSMLQWLGNFEEMMENQASISGEYSVVKAQAQEQKFLRKMLMDRQNEMQALLSMGRNLAADLEPSEKAAVEGQLDDLINRFDDANARSQERMEALEETLKVAKEFQNKLNPITEWLDRTEKKLKEMSTVPSDEEKIQRLLDEHDNLHDEILGQKPAFDDLTDVATALMSLIGDDEANALADKLQATTDRYGQLVEDSEVLGRLLQESKIGLRHLVLTYEDLLSWMDEMEARLSKYRILSVFVEKLLEQMDELTDLGEEVVSHEKQVAEVMDAGSHLMKHISSDEALQLKDKLDSIHRRYNDLSAKATDLHKAANEALPLVQQFHSAHERLGSWMLSVEGQLQSIDSSGQGPLEEEIERLAQEIQENRPLVEAVNLVGPQLCQISPGEGASNIETLVTRDNRRFEQICEQIQRRMERIHMSKQRSQEITQDIDELLGWFREVEGQMREAEPPSVDPEEIRVQLKEHKALNDDVASQKGRVRDVLSNAKKVLRESPHHEDTSELREKMDDLKETMESVSKLSSDRLSTLEQALPLAEHFFETHHELDDWLTAIESEAMVMDTPALRADKIIHQMERNKTFLQSIGDHKPLLDKLNKTGGALLKLVNDEDGSKIQELLESDNERYNALKYALRERGQALEDALQETSQFSDKLDGMLSSLAETADQVKNAEPISAHPEKIHEQVQENNGIIDDLDRKESAFVAVKAAAEEVINKASRNDPAVKDIKTKLDRLNKLWDMVQMATTQRGQSLEDALAMAEKFWEELQNVMTALKDLQETLKAQEPVAVEPQAIKQQREELSQIKNKIDQTKPEVEQVRQTGRDLMTLCGEADKPEVKKNIEDLDYAWDNVTALYAKREENLIDAMEKAMEFHDTLRNMLEFLEKAEVKFIAMGAVAGDIEAIKGQITQLHKFKDEVDPHMVKVEALNRSLRRQAQELKERTSPDQAAAIMEPLGEVNRRWDELLKGIVQRQRSLEYALLKLGQFQHALKELMVWIERTTKTVDDLKPVFGDPQVIEVELAKLKVTINDIQAHQSSVDTLNDAGRQLIEADKGSEDASNTHKKLTELNIKWSELQDKANGKQNDLESALREAQIFSAEIQDLLLWLGDIDAALSSSKPVGGLPETAKEQLLRFMEIYEDLEENRSKVENTLQQGQEYLKRSREGAATNLNHSLRTLKQRWESVMNRANDKKIKLEIALKEAKEFHDALQIFVDWLTEAENLLNAQQPVSRVLDIILQQIEEHNSFKKDVTAHREVMLSLDKKGTHLKYFSQKQDVILIKNLLVSVQHRWEKVVSKAAERTRALDLGFKEAKDFHDNWNELVTWLDDAESTLDDLAANVGNDPEKIKAQIAKHKEFQKALGAKQPSYDSTMKQGRGLQNKSPKSDEETLKQMMTDLKNKWNSVCQKSVDRQRKLEEALLFTGQFKDATQALLDWLKKVELGLVEDGPVHGDLDTVMALVEQHKAFCAELKNRSVQVESVRRTADELLIKASAEDAATIRSQITELVSSWEKVEVATEVRTRRLEEALQAAEQLHKVVHMLLDWLSDAEMKLRYAGPLPGGEEETRQQIAEHEAFLAELNQKEREKDDTIALAEEILAKAHPDGVATIKHWITIIQSRWEEVMAWARQRETRLADHLRSLRDLAGLLDELMRWLVQAENNLTVLEAEPLPDDIPAIEGLITDHKEFMDEMQKKEPDVLSICKPTKPRPSLSQQGKKRSRASIGRESVSPGRESSPEYDYPSRRSSRISPDRESSPGPKSRKSSRSSPAREITPTREYPRPWMYGARTTPPRESSPGADRERDWPLTHLRFATSTPTPSAAATAGGRKSSKASVREEPQIKNPQARALWEKWQHVGFMAWERMRRLHDKLSYLHELEKLKNFSWEEWRKRFMKFMNHKKSRVTDLFRKMDSDNDGAVPREDFIDGILKTKFPTSRLEMGTVADIFDRNQDGYIDYQEFIAALRPDWERKGPLTDAERIDDEVQKQVAKCTCRQKFRVHQVGEGKYRFGDSQKLRLVRILRSTVMVRVGGGWVALDEFLVKNDPCRVCPSIPELEQVGDLELHEHGCPLRGKTSPAGSCRSSSKGRTNVELREQFILAEGVSQSMTPFKSKPSPNSSVSSQSGTPAQQRSQSLPNSGPIMKVRERTAKSSAMGRTSFSAGTPDSSFSEEGGTSSFQGGKRKASAPVTSRSSYNTSGESQPGSRTGSRPPSRGPGSRPGSRPPSRAGSEVSLDSFDGGRTPMKRTPSFTGRTRAPSSQTSGVQRSSSLRKASAPVKSSTGTVNGTGTRAISVSSRSRSMTRTPSASSIPVAVASSSRTNLSGSTSNLNVAGTPLRSRTSSTTSLNSNHSTSKIPTLRQKMSATHTTTTSKTSTTSRTRTPSGSSSTGGSTKIVRKSSAASDTPSGAARKTGIVEPRRKL
ncbi:microtubule-actin cross-linking factor 1-like isoform X9 [Homarus americanus]|uniref:microtubule-actin cross-linking factor 1-like isoform X9 n=1 Tax=Homarus americanus TaxID=6706 RepID=UPI001C4848C5|nr:microtubule-actin cross-linking factor 1-like isoform X9 [Homarus americanus]